MNMIPVRNITHFLFPGGLLFISCIGILYSKAWLKVASIHIDMAGLIILAFGIFLVWRFDRNRVFYALTLMVVADIADRWFIDHPSFVTLHHIVSVLVPFNFFLLALFREKGVGGIPGILQLGMLPLQGALVYAWLTIGESRYHELLWVSHLPAPFNLVPDIFFAVFLLALTAQILRYFRSPSPIESAFIWAILCSGTAAVMTPGIEPTLFRIFAVLIVIVSILEMSHALAYRDELTGLPSRRALNDTLRKTGSRYTIAMADIDHFKTINDTYGHDIGDQVLKMVASRLRGNRGGQSYRYGGEEFCIVLKGKDREESLKLLEEVRQSVADEPFIIRQKLRPVRKPKTSKRQSKTRKSIRVTVSIGAAERGGDLKAPGDVMKAADQALYKAKKAGRNRVRG